MRLRVIRLLPIATLTLGAALCAPTPAPAQEARFDAGRFDIGLRGVLIFAKGEPSNDMIGSGLAARWEFRDSWHLGLSFDSVSFDYETPNLVLGIPSVEVVDPSNDFSRVSLSIERRYPRENRALSWFWTAGVGLASIDVGEPAVGTTLDGGSFDIETTADDEVHVFAGGGLRRQLSEHWAFEGLLTIQQHDTDYLLVDRVSGATGTIGSHTAYGLTLGFSYGF